MSTKFRLLNAVILTLASQALQTSVSSASSHVARSLRFWQQVGGKVSCSKLSLRGGADDSEKTAELEGFSKLGLEGDGEKKSFNVVLVGHVDAGKSTISGQLLYLSGMLDERTLEKYEREAKNLGRESWKFAWAMDQNEEERAKGKTHELGKAEFETEKRQYTILDAPGHKNFVPEMMCGAAQAEAAIMVISARKGEFEAGFDKGGQTREHSILVKTLGVQALVVGVNKMDEVEWSQERFDEIRTKYSQYLKTVGFTDKDVTYVPISGLHGINFKTQLSADVCPWYAGPTLLQALDAIDVAITGTPRAELPLRLPLTEKYRDGETFVLGKVECGTLSKGEVVRLMPADSELSVSAIIVNSREVDTASAGDIVRLKVKGIEEDKVHIGDVMVPCKPSHGPVVRFEVKINILDCKSIITSGYPCVLHIHTLEADCMFGELKAVVEKKKKDAKPSKPRFLRQGQTATLDLELSAPAWIDTYKEVPQLGRFALRDEGVTVAVGIVTELYEE